MKDETILINATAEAPQLDLRRVREAGVELGLERWRESK